MVGTTGSLLPASRPDHTQSLPVLGTCDSRPRTHTDLRKPAQLTQVIPVSFWACSRRANRWLRQAPRRQRLLLASILGRGLPSRGCVTVLECAQSMDELLAREGLGPCRADVRAETCYLPDGDKSVQPLPVASVPSIRRREAFDIVTRRMAEPAVHVVDLDQIPLTGADSDVIQVPEHNLA